MRTTNPAKAKSIEVTEKVVFPDATEQVSAPNAGCAHMYIVATAPTTLTTANTYYKLAGTTAAYVCTDFSHSNNRLTYILALTRRFLINIAFSISSNAKDINVLFELHKNSTEIVASRIKRTLRAVSDIYIMAMMSAIQLEQNEYIELWASADTNNVQITLETMGFTVWG